MYHPNQYQAAGNAMQQDRLRQAAAHRAARIARRPRRSPAQYFKALGPAAGQLLRSGSQSLKALAHQLKSHRPQLAR